MGEFATFAVNSETFATAGAEALPATPTVYLIPSEDSDED